MTQPTATTERLAAVRAVKRRFEARGVNLAAWARERGFSPQHVYDVLNGRSAGRRGNAHAVAVLLGLKDNAADGLCPAAPHSQQEAAPQ